MNGTAARRKPPPDWDARYAAAAGGLYGEGPNEYVRMMWARSDFHPASALMLADGDGRNGSWLAAKGVAVTAVDISRVATGRALERDRALGVAVERITADLTCWSPPGGRVWDAVFLIYLHCEPEVRLRALGLAASALAPGGWVVVEGFSKAQAERAGMGPDRPEPLYSIDELEAACRGMTVVEALAGRVLLDEGGMHRGEAEIVRFAARRDQGDSLNR